jgi:hypothetical protein
VSLADIYSKPAEAQSLSIDVNGKPFAFFISFGELQKKARLYSKRPTKTIKAWMKENAVAPWRRLAMPIVSHNEQVVGLKLDDEFVFSELFIDAHELNQAALESIQNAIDDFVHGTMQHKDS